MTRNPQNQHIKRRSSLMPVFILLSGVLLFSNSCSLGPHGSLQRSNEVTQAFESQTIFPSYRYYHSGWANNPYVIIAIDQNYTLADRLWSEFTPTSQELNKLMAALYNNYDYYPYGAYILDHSGKHVGVWYSAIQWANVRVNDDTRTVEILPNTPYLGDEKRTIGRL